MLFSDRALLRAIGAAGCVAFVGACAAKSSGGDLGALGSSDEDGSVGPGSSGPGGTGSGAVGVNSSTGGGNGSASSGSSAASSGGASSGSSAASSSGAGHGSGASSGSSAASSSGAATTVTGDGGPSCAATVASGAIALTSNYLPGSVIADGGYPYAYDDAMGSTACLDATALCATGTTAVTNASGSIWGAGLGLHLNQAVATSAASPAVSTYAATGTGISYVLSDLPPQGMRLIIDDGGTDYCAPLGAASGTVYWASFNTACWNGSGTSLGGPPATATHVQFQVTADKAATPFNFCVTSVAFATGSPPPAPEAGSTGGGGNGTGGCSWSGGPTSGGDGELTCYWFGQGTSAGGGCPSYKTYCGYCGSESGGNNGGYCPTGITDSVSNIATAPYFAAFPAGSFGQGTYCGMCVDVSYQGKTITATIVDECATCTDSGGHIDLGLAAAAALDVGQGNGNGDPTSGVTWEAVACPVSGDVVAVYNGSSSQIYFQNVAFPVASATAGGATATQSDGFWNFGTDVGGKSVTLTDTLGHTITGTIPNSSGASIGAQFPATCN
jgi:hypothetical protein